MLYLDLAVRACADAAHQVPWWPLRTNNSASCPPHPVHAQGLSSEAAAAISDVLQAHPVLQQLLLSRNALRDEGLRQLCAGTWKGLAHLELADCGITAEASGCASGAVRVLHGLVQATRHLAEALCMLCSAKGFRGPAQCNGKALIVAVDRHQPGCIVLRGPRSLVSSNDASRWHGMRAMPVGLA